MRLLLLLGLVAACGDETPHNCIVRTGAIASCGGGFPDANGPIETGPCNPLEQTGCEAGKKCTWIIDQTTPAYVGHVGCVPAGSAQVGAACEFGPAGVTGYDNCANGAACSSFSATSTPGTCKSICDNAGGNPMCGSDETCVAELPLFSNGASSPAAAGLCETACDPLADNDFDGSGSALARTGSACGSPTDGCYGIPSQGTPPRTQFWCMPDEHYATPLRHRSDCTIASGCADATGTIDVNSCNQGYEPLLYAQTGVTIVICVAFCAPLDCYAGNCGSNNVNRLGAAPHRCANPDALGTFGSGEECQYLWHDERDGSGTLLRSPYSDTVGYCVDRDVYGEPRCEDLPLHGSGSALGAVDLGCVSTQTAAQ